MGCGVSRPRVSPKRPTTEGNTGIMDLTQPLGAPDDVKLALRNAIAFILKQLRTIKIPADICPPLALSSYASPALLCKMIMDGVEIKLPVFVVSSPPVARILCFGHVSIFSGRCMKFEDTEMLIRNIGEWLIAGYGQSKTLVIGFSEEMRPEIMMRLKAQGMVCDVGDLSTDLSEYRAIFTSSNLVLEGESEQKMQEFVKSGGGLAVFYEPGDVRDIPMNKFLYRYGIQYSSCRASAVRSIVERRIPRDSTPARHIKWNYLVSDLGRMLNDCKDVYQDTSNLDEFVSNMRYHIMASGDNELHDLLKIKDLIENYFSVTNFTNDGKCVAAHVSHRLLAILYDCLLQKLSLGMIERCIWTDIFPGDTSSLNTFNCEMKLRIRPNMLVSTGLWLPSMHSGSIECEKLDGGLVVQVGAHSTPLFCKTEPWHRWPNVTSYCEVTDRVTEMSTVFGGPVYISGMDLEHETEITVKVSGVSMYPRAVVNKPDIWSQTKDLAIEWAELASKKAVVFLPKKYVIQEGAVEKAMSVIDELIDMVAELMNYTVVRPFRIVFDVDIVNNHFSPGYPIVLSEETINSVLWNRKEPSGELFYAMMAIAITCMRRGCFNHDTEQSLGAFVATICFSKIWPDFDPEVWVEADLPFMFRDLWIIHTKLSSTCLLDIIRAAQSDNATVHETPDEMWISFVKQLSQLCQRDLVRVFEKYHPINTTLVQFVASYKKINSIDSL